jgi:hypothetical protein
VPVAPSGQHSNRWNGALGRTKGEHGTLFLVAGSRICVVSFKDLNGFEHSTEVGATSLYEASVLGLRQFRTAGFASDIAPSANTRLKVTLKAEETSHEVSVHMLEQWLQSMGKSPREQALKHRLRELLNV